LSLDYFAGKYKQDEIQESIDFITTIIREEALALNEDYERIFLASFSQGATIALGTWLQLNPPEILGGIFCYGGVFGAALEWTDINFESKKQTPVYMCAGSADRIVTKKYAEMNYNWLVGQGLGHIQF
jgi:predicted esterase